MTRHDPDHDSVGDALARIRGRRWPGGERNQRVELFLKEVRMNTRSRWKLGTVLAIGLVGGLVSGGTVAGLVTHYVAQRAVLMTSDGQEFEVELTPEGPGVFVTDEGEEHRFEVVGEGGKPGLMFEKRAGEEHGWVASEDAPVEESDGE